jgi:hypothetical protein
MKKMNWGVEAVQESECVCALVAAGPKMSLQQNLPSDRMALAETINSHHGVLTDKKLRLDEKFLAYQEHHNLYAEKKADLIATASEPPFVNEEGKNTGWDKLASDSASKRTKHKLDLVEAATQGQLDHAKTLLAEVVGHEKFHNTTHSAMSKAAQGHSDFEDAVSHSQHLSQKAIDHIKTTLVEHVASHKRFLGRITNAKKALARGMTASLVESSR